MEPNQLPGEEEIRMVAAGYQANSLAAPVEPQPKILGKPKQPTPQSLADHLQVRKGEILAFKNDVKV